MTTKTKSDKVATEAYVDAAVLAGGGSVAADTIIANPTGGSAVPAASGLADVTAEATPASGDYLLGWESGGALRKFDIGDLPAGGLSAIDAHAILANATAGSAVPTPSCRPT